MAVYLCNECGTRYESGLFGMAVACPSCRAPFNTPATAEDLELNSILDDTAIQEYERLLADQRIIHYVQWGVGVEFIMRAKDPQLEAKIKAINMKQGKATFSGYYEADALLALKQAREKTAELASALKIVRDEYPRIYELTWYSKMRGVYRKYGLIPHDRILGSKPPGPQPASSSNCFVATAVYGSDEAATIEAFRLWRDTVLARLPMGLLAIRWYYRIGPSLALLVRRAPQLRIVLKPILDFLARRLQVANRRRHS